MAALVDLDEARLRLGGAEVEDDVLTAVIDDVSSLARLEAGAAGDAWDKDAVPSSTVPDAVAAVVYSAVRRRIAHGDKLTERLGEYSYSTVITSEGSPFTDYEVRILRRYRDSDGIAGGLSSVRLVRPGIEEAALTPTYIPVTGQADLPWSNE